MRGIIVFGASGSGTTTLGSALAESFGCKHFDIDDYYWRWDTDVPYTVKRERSERQKLLLADLEQSDHFVMSGNIRSWDEPFLPLLDLAVYVAAPTEIRIERLRKREFEDFGDRVLEGGDLHENHNEFLEYSASYDSGGMDIRSKMSLEAWMESLPCPILRLNGTQPVAENVRTAAEYRAQLPWNVHTWALGTLRKYRYVVVFAQFNGKWLYSRHKKRETFETAGGHIEPGETPLDAAKRELFEETGALDFGITPAFDYSAGVGSDSSNGQVFLAGVAKLGDLPDSEMAEVRAFDTIPERMTYPAILPVLYDEMLRWSVTASSADELWDVLDENRNPTGRTCKRGPMQPGDFHTVVHVWVRNKRGEFLITRRAPNKEEALFWECTGGSAVAGDTSLDAAVREVQEEMGITLDRGAGRVMFTRKHENDFADIWLFDHDCDIAEVVLQPGETCDVKLATVAEIRRMVADGEFYPFTYLERLFAMLDE